MKEYHSFYFIAWLTRKRSRTNICFVTAFRSYLPVQSGLGIQFVLAWIGLKQARSWFRFPAWVLVSGVTCSAPRVALETLLACFAVAWRHRESSPLLWSCWARYSVVLRLWHGLGLLGWFRCESPAGRLPGQPCWKRAVTSSGAPESCKREKRQERAARVSFLTVRFLDIPKGGWSNQSVGTGRSPACTAALARHFHVRTDNLFVVLYSNSYRVYTFILSPHSLSYWFIQFCNHS